MAAPAYISKLPPIAGLNISAAAAAPAPSPTLLIPSEEKDVSPLVAVATDLFQTVKEDHQLRLCRPDGTFVTDREFRRLMNQKALEQRGGPREESLQNFIDKTANTLKALTFKQALIKFCHAQEDINIPFGDALLFDPNYNYFKGEAAAEEFFVKSEDQINLFDNDAVFIPNKDEFFIGKEAIEKHLQVYRDKIQDYEVFYSSTLGNMSVVLLSNNKETSLMGSFITSVNIFGINEEGKNVCRFSLNLNNPSTPAKVDKLSGCTLM